MTNLLIVESPGKIKKIQSFLGAGWTVAASIGHVRDLPKSEIGVAPPNFTPQFQPTDRGAEQIAKLSKLAKTATEVWLATDADREGEGIAWHLQQTLGLKQPKRATFTEISDRAVKQAIAAPRTINNNLVAAQTARRVLDRLVGYMASKPVSNMTGQPMSAGRVQSPAVRLLVERERAIRDFKIASFFDVDLLFSGVPDTPETQWTASWDPIPLLPKGQQRCTDQALAAAVAQIRDVTVVTYKDGTAKRAPPAPFITSTLQQAAYNRLKLGPEQTMQIAQKLYEQGVISYMRTDSTHLSAEVLAEISMEAQARGHQVVAPARTWGSKAGAQEAHEAIHPVHMRHDTAGTTAEEQAVYVLIWERTLACQLPDATYATRAAGLEGSIPNMASVASFKANGRTLLTPGWLAAMPGGDDTANTGQADPSNPIPLLVERTKLTAADGKLLAKKTKPPSRFNLASLVRALEEEGIGRPSTYASILSTIAKHAYVEEKAHKLYATPKAEQLVTALVSANLSFIDLGFTKEMETRLDLIAEGKQTYREVISEFYAQLSTELLRLQPVLVPGAAALPVCPDCGKPMRLVQLPGKTPFHGCTGYPACKRTISAGGAKAPIATPAKAAAAHTKGSPRALPACPACGGQMTENDKVAGCDCGLKVWKTIAGRALTGTELRTLLTKRRTAKLDGFTSKAGKVFSAIVRLDDQFKTAFEFDNAKS